MSDDFWSELWAKIKGLLKSRKFWALVVGIVVAVFGERAGVDPDALLGAIVTIVTYIIGTALEDGLSRRA
jgi:cation transporter-like permease